MSGIAGILDLSGRGHDLRGAVAAMGDSIAHRGERQRVQCAGPLALVVRDTRHRPVELLDDNPSGIVLAFEGRLSNEGDGEANVDQTGRDDANAVSKIARLYVSRGAAGLCEALEGCYAFLLWDARQKRLVLG